MNSSLRLQLRACSLLAAVLSVLPCSLLAGCGGHSNARNCGIIGITVLPASATADHTAAPPGNSVNFISLANFGPTCTPPPPAVFAGVTWSVSDPVNISISNVNPNPGTATCNGATAGAATVTASGTLPSGAPVSATASLTCK